VKAPPRPAAELAALCAVIWLAMVAVPVGLGGIGLSWDALNHHIYLGWVANQPRFGHDLFAASFQSYQYPYLYWPAYQLFIHGFSGVGAGVVLVSLNLILVPPLWMVARSCIPDATWMGLGLRAAAVVLAFLGQVSLSLIDTTANDVLAAAPLVWSVALALAAADSATTHRWLSPRWAIALSGLCAGLSVAFKLSNGPLALALPLLWMRAGSSWRERARAIVSAGLWSIAGFILAYGYWGALLWKAFGNPVFPFLHPSFEPLRALTGWHR